jgi:hypothetical protein
MKQDFGKVTNGVGLDTWFDVQNNYLSQSPHYFSIFAVLFRTPIRVVITWAFLKKIRLTDQRRHQPDPD